PHSEARSESEVLPADRHPVAPGARLVRSTCAPRGCGARSSSHMVETLLTHLPSFEVDVCVERVFSRFAGLHLFEYELDEVGFAIVNDLFYDLLGVFFAWPGCLSGGSIAVSSSAAGSYPITESAASISEVSMPTERC